MTVIYKPNEVMKKLNLKESTYKKYIGALEDGGYAFKKNQQGHRYFTEEDIQTLEYFMELIRYDGMTIESVAKKIGESKGHDGMPEPTEDSYDVMAIVDKAVTTALLNQEKLLIDKFQEHFQQTYKKLTQIETKDNERDQLLLQSIRESQEVKKLLLEVKEQMAAAKEERKSWWQFWKK